MKHFVTIAFFTALLALAGCKKDHGVLGVDVQPSGDALSSIYSDTAAVYAHTIGYDSTISANDQYKFLGSNADPHFGKMDVSLNVNLNMNVTNLNFGSDANIRSAEIILVVNPLYYVGKRDAQLTFSVYALDSTLNVSRLYYTNNTRLYNRQALLGTVTTSFTAYGDKQVLHIPINNSYAQAILTNPQYLVSNDMLQATYKGFYITASNGADDGIIYQCDLDDDASGFYLNYQNGTPSATRQDRTFKFAFTGTGAKRFNTVKYQPQQGGTANLVRQIITRDSTGGIEDLYLKGLGVTKVKVHIPSLTNFSSASDIAINRAELVFHVDPSFVPASGTYTAPPRLALLPMDSTGRETYALDQADAARYDGTYDAANNRYVFNIARQAELIALHKVKNYGFYLVIANTQILYTPLYDGKSKEMAGVSRSDYSERVVLAGSSKGNLKPTLSLTYVKLKK